MDDDDDIVDIVDDGRLVTMEDGTSMTRVEVRPPTPERPWSNRSMEMVIAVVGRSLSFAMSASAVAAQAPVRPPPTIATWNFLWGGGGGGGLEVVVIVVEVMIF